MTDDEARDLFSAYHDRELTPEEHERVRAALEASPALTKEYESFCELLQGLSNIAVPQGAEAAPAHTERAESQGVDLLAGVQSRLHKRSAGKFYKDRWSRAAGIFPMEVLAALVLLGLIAAYYAMTSITIEPAPDQPATTAPSR
jgi:anti-sigma factor RsiW